MFEFFLKKRKQLFEIKKNNIRKNLPDDNQLMDVIKNFNESDDYKGVLI